MQLSSSCGGSICLEEDMIASQSCSHDLEKWVALFLIRATLNFSRATLDQTKGCTEYGVH